MTVELRYRAFISYSHRDSHMAARLHKKLESYQVPQHIRSTKSAMRPGRIRPVFRDRDDLATSESLTSSIQEALDDSEALIVICSPDAVASQWVNEEIAYFRRQHPTRPAFAFVVRGNPAADPVFEPENAALPRNLLLTDISDPDGLRIEPLASDARPEADGFSSAFLKLAAGLLGVNYDELRNRELRRRTRRWVLVGCFSLVLTGVFAVLAWRATVARNEARTAKAQAELELMSERQTREFLLSAFRLADPGESRGTTITVREVLDSAVARIDSTDFARPVIKSRFLATMGQAYSSLGMNHRSVELLRQSLETLPEDERSSESWRQQLSSQIELSDVLFTMGSYDEALALLDLVGSGESAGYLSLKQGAESANIRGDIFSYLEQDAEAMAAFQAALSAIDQASLSIEEQASLRSRSLGGMATLHLYAGDYDASQAAFAEAVNILLPVYGEMHPDTIWALISYGSAAYANGDTEKAREVWTRSLAVARELLDETHPEVGTIKNNLARLQFETGNYLQAEALLRDALEIDRNHRGDDFDDLAYTLNNLALVRMAQGDYAEAANLWREALPIARASEHRMLGPILIGLADVQCQGLQMRSGFGLSEQAVAVTIQQFGVDDWRSHRAVLTRAYCQKRDSTNPVRKPVNAVAARAAAGGIIERWGQESFFGTRASLQLNEIFTGQ